MIWSKSIGTCYLILCVIPWVLFTVPGHAHSLCSIYNESDVIHVAHLDSIPTDFQVLAISGGLSPDCYLPDSDHQELEYQDRSVHVATIIPTCSLCRPPPYV